MLTAPPGADLIERPPSLTSIAFDKLLVSIEKAELPYGAMLSEKQVSSLYGVSKTPVREAFLGLRNLGLVDILPQRGYLVHYPSAVEVRELCDVRLELECAGLRLSKDIAWNRLLAAMTAATEGMVSLGDRLEVTQYSQLDDNFHLAFFGYCGNSLLKWSAAAISRRSKWSCARISRPFWTILPPSVRPSAPRRRSHEAP